MTSTQRYIQSLVSEQYAGVPETMRAHLRARLVSEDRHAAEMLINVADLVPDLPLALARNEIQFCKVGYAVCEALRKQLDDRIDDMFLSEQIERRSA